MIYILTTMVKTTSINYKALFCNKIICNKYLPSISFYINSTLKRTGCCILAYNNVQMPDSCVEYRGKVMEL